MAAHHTQQNQSVERNEQVIGVLALSSLSQKNNLKAFTFVRQDKGREVHSNVTRDALLFELM